METLWCDGVSGWCLVFRALYMHSERQNLCGLQPRCTGLDKLVIYVITIIVIMFIVFLIHLAHRGWQQARLLCQPNLARSIKDLTSLPPDGDRSQTSLHRHRDCLSSPAQRPYQPYWHSSSIQHSSDSAKTQRRPPLQPCLQLHR